MGSGILRPMLAPPAHGRVQHDRGGVQHDDKYQPAKDFKRHGHNQISSDEDEVRACAISRGIYRHALGRTRRVGKGILIIVPRSWITKNGTCRTGWAGLRNTTAEESISLCRIARIDATIEGAATGCTGRRRCG